MNRIDFRDAVLCRSTFMDCDLAGTSFQHTDLSNADLSGAHSFSMDPNTNKLRGTKFSPANALGLLDIFDIKIV